MAERNVHHSDMFAVSSSRFICCRCRRSVVSAADEQLLPVPLCARHYVCRPCMAGGLSYCPGCVLPVSGWSETRGLSVVNGSTDANGNGATPSVTAVCNACGHRTDQSCYCQSCADVDRLLCQSCWQHHQLDVHVLPRLRLDATSTTSSCLSLSQPAALSAGDDRQRLSIAGAGASSMMRQLRPRDESTISSLLGGLSMYTDSSLVSNTAAGADGLLAVGLHDPAVRRGRLAALQSPLARQYEGWLWQALNNAGFEQAVRAIDERKQQIGVNLQSTLRDMEFRLERARSVLDELYRDYMRQVIDVCRCQMEALQVQSETLQRVRSAAARLQHARLYNDKTRAVVAETELASALRHNAASTCLRPCDDGAVEFRSPTDDDLRAYLRSSCVVDSAVHAPHCSVQSVDRDVNCLSWTLVGRVSEFDIQLRSHCHAGVDDTALTVLISDSHGVELKYDYERRAAGHYVVRYRPLLAGTHHIYVLLRDRHLADSPYTVGVTEPLCYRLTDSRTVWNLRPVVSLSYNLVKPWGVCYAADSHHLLVADRDAHSVLVFDRSGSFVARRSSSFRRPTHLAVTSRGHVVVTDKDNHRIQIFTSSWSHVRTFGSEGDRDGQFRYPWEVAVNSADELLVSDSKNYRVQLFTVAGVFIAKHCLERASRDDKDGPRGVAFSPNDFAAVADFDMLRVLVLSPDLRCVVHVIGVPGLTSTPRSPAELRTKGCIERPRGLAFDAGGNLIVVQARTNRETNSLLKFTLTGDCVEHEFDKDACGVCVCCDGRIAVVQPQTGVVVYADV